MWPSGSITQPPLHIKVGYIIVEPGSDRGSRRCARPSEKVHMPRVGRVSGHRAADVPAAVSTAIARPAQPTYGHAAPTAWHICGKWLYRAVDQLKFYTAGSDRLQWGCVAAGGLHSLECVSDQRLFAFLPTPESGKSSTGVLQYRFLTVYTREPLIWCVCEMSDFALPAPIKKIHMPPDRGPGFWWGLWDPLASLLMQAHCPNWDLWVWWHPGSKGGVDRPKWYVQERCVYGWYPSCIVYGYSYEVCGHARTQTHT